MPDSPHPPPPARGPDELVVVTHPEAGFRGAGLKLAAEAADVDPMARVLRRAGAALHPLFGPSEARVRAEAAFAAEAAPEMPDLGLFYRVEAPPERLADLAAELREEEAVEAAYLKPGGALPVVTSPAPATAAPPTPTPDFTPRQGYLDAAPGGVDARHAWAVRGGTGAGVRIVDVEGNWNFAHEDLQQHVGGLIAGILDPSPGAQDHGTAVFGVMGADRNDFGVTGIAPGAEKRAVSLLPHGCPWAVRTAADHLGPGDLLLIEWQRPGPRYGFQPIPDPTDAFDAQRGFVAVEWWPDDFAAIRYATARGVIVVEAGGNGAEDLDDALYDVNPAPPYGPFPSWWRNPYRRDPLDSGAVVVGAGAPPPARPGSGAAPDRSRLWFSDHGSLVDAQGWGLGVVTTGFGNLQNGPDPNRWYVDSFAGTSSASPIVLGALACVQGALRARGLPPLDPPRARALLRATGSPQQPGPGAPVTQRIGTRPDLRELLAAALPRG